MTTDPAALYEPEIVAVALRRLGLLPLHSSSPASPEMAAAVILEAAHVGVRFTNESAITDGFVRAWPVIAQAVSQYRGGCDEYAPLFAGFPDHLPSWDFAGLRFAMVAARLLRQLTPIDVDFGSAWRAITSDPAVMRDAMDFSNLGWWPASSLDQDLEADALAKAAQAVRPGDTRIIWLDVLLVDAEELADRLAGWTQTLAAFTSSPSPGELADFECLIDLFGPSVVDIRTVTFTEIRARLLARMWSAAAAGDSQADAQLRRKRPFTR